MEKRELSNVLSEIFIPIGFKKKGDYWLINSEIVTKIVNLQKSNFGNKFYINYGYILKSIPLGNLMMHVFKGLDFSNTSQNIGTKELLNLDHDISNDDRIMALKKIITDKLIPDMMSVNTEEDLLKQLKERPHLNDVPLVVKNHFNLQ